MSTLSELESVASLSSFRPKRTFSQRLHQRRRPVPLFDFFQNQLLFKLRYPGQMDWDYAFRTALDLLKMHPERVYRATQNRNEIKGHYSRDDPAFMLLLYGVTFASMLTYGLIRNSIGVFHPVMLIGIGLKSLVWFLGSALVMGTVLFTMANRYFNSLSQQKLAGVEWLYCVDVHCNAFLFPFVWLSVSQLVLMPFLSMGGLLPTVTSNSLFLFAACEYVRVTVLGFLHLPLVNRDNVLVLWAPAFAAVLIWFVLSLLNISCSELLLG
ncbi:hypothetical protein BASA82_000829 [Batrachochytrium salamandrivorans]|nr:hypothetical protein BASA81_004517 [Batrachochytrium salamandrivorans]KAH9262101.1 hypothetical protein BASA82_000829 [Batrachochytrium salamandrivorans]